MELVGLDEATSALDLDMAGDLENIFKKLDKTIVSISHRQDIDYSKLYDRILKIKDRSINSIEL